MAFDNLPVIEGPTIEEEGGDDGWALYLLWRYVLWRRRRNLPEVNLDDPERIKQLVAELEELFGDLLERLRAGAIHSPEAP